MINRLINFSRMTAYFRSEMNAKIREESSGNGSIVLRSELAGTHSTPSFCLAFEFPNTRSIRVKKHKMTFIKSLTTTIRSQKIATILALIIVTIGAAPADAGSNKSGDVMALQDDIVIDALFSNLDSVQDQLEICEEGLRQKLIKPNYEDPDMSHHDYIHITNNEEKTNNKTNNKLNITNNKKDKKNTEDNSSNKSSENRIKDDNANVAEDISVQHKTNILITHKGSSSREDIHGQKSRRRRNIDNVIISPQISHKDRQQHHHQQKQQRQQQQQKQQQQQPQRQQQQQEQKHEQQNRQQQPQQKQEQLQQQQLHRRQRQLQQREQQDEEQEVQQQQQHQQHNQQQQHNISSLTLTEAVLERLSDRLEYLKKSLIDCSMLYDSMS
ncbi:hypothetical protein PoB_002096300 [Plakobranchus ocellatus]|uniref:Uncharacterized protein n=1 Tax=Plakobranchus ocellatus TaxID=259542 RepID=A0AAV3ZI17_9GAST|nr:hypothetical protein PoB_002096300 [Plakobranchus ocellatus]